MREREGGREGEREGGREGEEWFEVQCMLGKEGECKSVKNWFKMNKMNMRDIGGTSSPCSQLKQ